LQEEVHHQVEAAAEVEVSLEAQVLDQLLLQQHLLDSQLCTINSNMPQFTLLPNKVAE